MAKGYIAPAAFQGHLGLRVRYYRRQKEWTQKTLAAESGINQGYLSSIEKGRRTPSPATLHALASALDIPPLALTGSSTAHDAARPLETLELPLLGHIPAGPPATSQEYQETYPVLRHLWAPDRYCLRLTFDSMEPTLIPGDLVLVHAEPNLDPLRLHGRICVCTLDGQSTLKRLFVEAQQGERRLLLRGDNPERTPILVESLRDLRIQGVVTHLVSREL